MAGQPDLSRSQRHRRTNDYPLTWEPFALAGLALVMVIVLAAHLGRALAGLVAGDGWLWPLHEDLITSVVPVLRGDPRAGLPPSATVHATPALLRICVAVTELAALAGYVAALTALLRRWGPNRAKGMASRHEAETLLGRTRLRRVRRIIRPDLYTPPSR